MSGKHLETLARDTLKQQQTIRGYFSNLFRPNTSSDEIGELFNQAGNAYILEKKVSEAIECYMCAYEEYDKIKECDHYAIKNLSLVITHAKQTNEFTSQQLISFLTILAKKYGKNGKMKEHNDKYLEISNICEQDGNLDEALSSLDNCVVVDSLYYDDVVKKKAELLIKLNKYIEAGNIYDRLAGTILNRGKTTSLYYTRPYCALSILCDLAANDLVNANIKYKEYVDRDNMFDTDYEGKLVISALRAIESQNIDDFELACNEYDRVLKLKPLHTILLTVAKKYITNFEEDEKIDKVNNDYNEEDFC